jgi:hypothetical protein
VDLVLLGAEAVVESGGIINAVRASIFCLLPAVCCLLSCCLLAAAFRLLPVV